MEPPLSGDTVLLVRVVLIVVEDSASVGRNENPGPSMLVIEIGEFHFQLEGPRFPCFV
jgi:hypothetical protein